MKKNVLRAEWERTKLFGSLFDAESRSLKQTAHKQELYSNYSLKNKKKKQNYHRTIMCAVKLCANTY